nr:ABC transporter substrate-binding protein [Kibdelosporangium sp. MJ126-NF4]CEL19780.1 Alkanesulfonates-binding protein [Kibdelosporangium sp. MJ126-NF4]CTQ97005.1 Alkanesulfonates-binding protein [Kibdelosporangium sp. MJ126-NF4]
MVRRKRHTAAVALSLGLVLAGCADLSTVDDPVPGYDTAPLPSLSVGYVSAIDQIGMPVALETGMFEEHGLDVRLSQPFPTGVDALNALQAGEVDFVQVGTPVLAAVQKGLDVVLVGNYTGSASVRSIDETMAVVAAPRSGVTSDLSTLRGKRIGVSVGSINHLYLLGLLQSIKLDPGAVTVVNTAPPDLPIALQTGGIDVAIGWDPWPLLMTKQVSGAREILRGGSHIPYVGYIVARREYVERNQDVVRRILAARAQADQWMRQNPDKAGESAARWLPGTPLEIARQAIRNNLRQLDPRLSVCNFLALDTVARLLAAQGVVKPGFDVDRYLAPDSMARVAADNPRWFQDLPAVPSTAVIASEYRYDRETALKACPE